MNASTNTDSMRFASGDLESVPVESPAPALVAVLAVFAWSAAMAALFGGLEFWIASPPNFAHLAIDTVCAAIVVFYAGQARGGLEFKLGQAVSITVAVFGLYAVAILAGRLFFSRWMFLSAALGAWFIASLLIWVRHRLAPTRVAIIAPLVGEASALPHLGKIISDPNADLRRFDIVLVSLTETVSADWARALSRAMLAGCKVRHIGEYIEELSGAVSLEHFEFDHLSPSGIASYRPLKRLIDVAMVVFILPMAVTIVSLGALAILLTMGRPIFFLQERVGLGGVPFRMWKLRTMRPEREGEALRAAVVGDSRVTPVGRILRRFRIDELPQFWNVLKGDMSLIGPRPEATALHKEYLAKLPNYPYRYLVRPGITGWAQVNCPPSASADEAKQKLTYDLFYVKNLSLFLDIRIFVKTFWTITAGGGVR